MLPFPFFTHTLHAASLRTEYSAVRYAALENIVGFPDEPLPTVSRGNWFVVGPIVSPIDDRCRDY